MERDFTKDSDAKLLSFWSDGDGSLSWLERLEEELRARGFMTRYSDGSRNIVPVKRGE